MIRRHFLQGMLAACSAPAIVRAESIMRIWVPPQGVVNSSQAQENYDDIPALMYRQLILRNELKMGMIMRGALF